MKKVVIAVTLLFSSWLVLSQAANAADTKETNKQTSDKFYQGKQGEAKDALEKTAGKKTDDVKVPDVSKPSPAK